MILDDGDFARRVLANYDNPACVDMKEFQDDLRRFNTLNRLLSNTEIWNGSNYRKCVNSLTILYNLFGDATNSLLKYRVNIANIPRVVAISAYLNRLTEDLGQEEEQDKEFRENLNVIG